MPHLGGAGILTAFYMVCLCVFVRARVCACGALLLPAFERFVRDTNHARPCVCEGQETLDSHLHKQSTLAKGSSVLTLHIDC